MKTVILTETQIRNVIDKIITEQNSVRTESTVVDLGAVWPSGKWKMTPQQMSEIEGKLRQITDFIKKNKDSKVTIQIESGESRVTNYDGETGGKVALDPGVLSQRRGEQIITYLNGFFQKLIDGGVITKMPELPKPITKIGNTPYSGPKDLQDPNKKEKYSSEQYVKAIISLKKDYECIVGMEITIAYLPGKNSQNHGCDEAIFDLKMNGVSLGEVNLNNGMMDVGVANLRNKWSKNFEVYNKRVERATKQFNALVASGSEKEKNREKFLFDMVGAEPQKEIPQSYINMAKAKGYDDPLKFVDAVNTINAAFAKIGRKTDNAAEGMRSQTFVLSGELAKQIIDNGAATDNITLSIVPLVSKEGKYKIFYKQGSHSDTPWVTIKSKKSETPLFDGEPNVGMKRGSTTETVLLRTDLCGNPLV